MQRVRGRPDPEHLNRAGFPAGRRRSRLTAWRAGPLGVLLVALLAAACSRENPGLQLEGPTMGTTWRVTISQPGELSREILQQELRIVLQDINRSMSTYIEDSELSELNRTQTTDEWLVISKELYTVLSAALEISFLTGGAFDVTVGPLVNLWGFGPGGEPQVPPEGAIAEAQQRIGYQNLRLNTRQSALRKTVPGLYLDLSGIAKGYAVDRLATILDGMGVGNYMVDIGGEIRTSGSNPDGEPWRIAIEQPQSGATREVQQVIRLQDMAMATSGDYRNYFEHNGERYSHTIDPRSGHPVTHDLASVSVLDESAMSADALATALLVMGPKQGLTFANRSGIPAFFIIRSDDGLVERRSEAFREYLSE